MKHLLITLSLIFMVSTAMQAQYVFSGSSGSYYGYIYEDGMADDGTRYIISDLLTIDKYAFSLCKFIPQEGNSWYGIAVESKEYIPRNGLLVFVHRFQGNNKTLVLGQRVLDKAIASKSTIGFSPTLFFGSNSLGGILMSLYPKTVTSEVSYSVYDLSEEDLKLIIEADFKEIRISSRTTYRALKGHYPKTVSKWLARAKGNVDERSEKSLNTILEDIE